MFLLNSNKCVYAPALLFIQAVTQNSQRRLSIPADNSEQGLAYHLSATTLCASKCLIYRAILYLQISYQTLVAKDLVNGNISQHFLHDKILLRYFNFYKEYIIMMFKITCKTLTF